MVAVNQYAKYLPYIAGLGYDTFVGPKQQMRSSRSYTRTRTQRKKKLGGQRSFAKAVASTLPTKHYTQTLTKQLLHQSTFTNMISAALGQGTTNLDRIGDSLTLCALRISGNYATEVGANNYTFRIMVGFTGEEYNLPTTLGTGLTSSELYLPNTSNIFASTGIINPKAFTKLHEEKFNVNSQISNVADLVSFDFTVPFNNMKFIYQSAGSIYGKTKNLVILVSGDVGGGTAGVSNSGNVIVACDFIFK